MHQICKIETTNFLGCRTTISTNTKATNLFFKVTQAEDAWLLSFGVVYTLVAYQVLMYETANTPNRFREFQTTCFD